MKSSYIHKLIRKGENQELDFKFEISSAQKIARTFVAFANQSGGKLLIGVDDKGEIIGIRSEEEKFMARRAAENYCKPLIVFKEKDWNINGKTILEITVSQGESKPYFALESDGNWQAYVRVDDQNLVAEDIFVIAWQKKCSQEDIHITFASEERILMKMLENNNFLLPEEFALEAGITFSKAESVISDFVAMDLINMYYAGKDLRFKLKLNDY